MRRLLLVLLFALLIPWQVWATTTLYVDTDAASPTHPTYGSLSAAITYLQGYNSGVLDDDFVIECSGATADTVRVTVANITTSATYTLTIRQASSDRHNGVVRAGIYVLAPSGTWSSALDLEVADYVIIDGLYINVANYEMLAGVTVSNSAGARLRNLLITSSRSGYGAQYLLRVQDYANDTWISNSLLIGGEGISHHAGAAHDLYIDNITVANAETGVAGSSVRTHVRNTIAVGCTDADFGAVATDSSNNISSDSTAPGSNSLTNQVAADLFTDPAGAPADYTLKSGSNAIGAGTSIASVTTDILGTSRPQGSAYDIGAFEYVAAASGWSGTIYGISPAAIYGVPVGDIQSVNGVE